MKFLKFDAPVFGLVAALGFLSFAACSDGSEGLKTKHPDNSGNTGGSGGTTGGNTSTAGGSVGTGGLGTTGGSSAGGTDGSGGSVGGSGGSGGSAAAVEEPFHMLILSRTLEFAHDSIPDGQQMLHDLGDAATTPLPATAMQGDGSRWDTTIATYDDGGGGLVDFTTENLKQYKMIFWANPTGTVFTSAANAAEAKAAFEGYIADGGSWGGFHSATDFEKTEGWNYFHDTIDAAYFTGHDGDGTPGSIVWETAATSADHPVIRGITSPWSCQDEWYFMNRTPGSDFTILGRLGSDQRPAVWVRDLPGGGRSFYTIRGHNKTVYQEPSFRQLIHQGILWAVHRME